MNSISRETLKRLTSENPDHNTFNSYKPLPGYKRTQQIQSATARKVHRKLMNVTRRLLTMWVDKVAGYGTSRYEEGSAMSGTRDIQFDAWMCYSDIHRKASRLEQLTKGVANEEPGALEGLLDTYADLALYCMSNIVILEEEGRKNALL